MTQVIATTIKTNIAENNPSARSREFRTQMSAGIRRDILVDPFKLRTLLEFDLTVDDQLRNIESLGKLETAPGTLHLDLRGVKISFLHYPYPLLFPLQQFDVLAIADPRDIACMKLEAVANRGSRRDFVDVYMAARTWGLREVLTWFGAKYAAVAYNRVHLFKSLTYFRDAEQQPMPDMLIPLSWDEVRTFFRREVPHLI